MRKVLIVLAILAIIYNGAEAGIFKDDVDLTDLSMLTQDTLETLKNTEFNVFLMKVKHAGAKASVKKANDDLETARLTLDAKKKRLKSSEADLKEAKATQDSARIDAAEKALHTAKKEFEYAKLLIRWKEKEVDVKAARVKKTKLAVSVAEHERDLARVSKLKEQNVPSAAKYSLSDFNKRLENKQRDYQKAASNEAKEMTEAKKRKAVYDSSSP